MQIAALLPTISNALLLDVLSQLGIQSPLNFFDTLEKTLIPEVSGGRGRFAVSLSI